ncbi:alkylhydroperoxidase/carboxymuconolactone decarboxylase family protein YurZ [Neobacillus bataviensis]|uniref:Alkylhydroperoxidase/carboxymuconolactone decarboxylase family protein YurZ n=1 Tax=Neobacillus bataviensis TaxID=220685 RepID=A0A561CEH3_9BACI|nr:carboxymuconolactone decarboxylase family protein [Neobacillus bataviensis]TWD89621.1 alkylhydroperoxidase/carboxymuconolactone decarboxylase family protein YurZ [Neobacillus bataviensis]
MSVNTQREELGYWNSTLNYLFEKDPEFFEIYKRFVSTPYKNNVIDAKSRELILVALSSSPTSLCKETLELHMKNAVSQGATEKEILEVLKLISVLGVHTCAVSVPSLVDEYEKYSNQSIEPNLNNKQKKLKEHFIDKMGYWNSFRDILLDNDENFFESYSDYLTNPWESNLLSPKLKEFIYIAIDSSTTHLFDAGTRVHIRNAFKYGATFEEIMEVFKLTSAQGVNTFYVSLPILKDIFSEKDE